MRSIRIFAISGALLLGFGLMPAVSATPSATSGQGSTSRGDQVDVRATMAGGNTVGDQVREATPRADGYRHIDTPRLIAQLKKLHVNTYLFQVWSSPTDWEDLVNEFAPAAQAAGIEVWPYIVPPDECYRFLPDGSLRPRHERGKCSAPYYEDYVAWADAIAKLSLKYPVVSNWAIDDFGNPATFTAEYMAEIKDAMESANPHLGLYATIYWPNAANDSFMDTFAPYISGVIFPYAGSVSDPHYKSKLTTQLDAVLNYMTPRQLELVFLNYTGRHLGSAIDETPEDVVGLLKVVRPYVADGRVAGIISYGVPMNLDLPAISSQNKARTGVGRLSLSDFGGSAAGEWAAGSQVVKVEPNQARYTVTFSDYDQFGPELPGTAGYYEKQLLIDDTVVWRQDATDNHQNEWGAQTVDVTEHVAGKSTVRLTFRLYELEGGPRQIDLGIDDVRGSGIAVRNGGFESVRHWALDATDSDVVPRIDLWAANQPRRLFEATAHEFALMEGVEAPEISDRVVRPPLNNRAMYGAGLLRLSVDYFSSSTERQCASATQRVEVKPGMPRYELSFWQYDTRAGYHEKKLTIDGFAVYNVAVFDVSPNMWQEGQQLIGPIDVTDQVQGKESVDVTFELCSLPGSPNYPTDVGFENLTSVGLDIRNPGFDQPGGWTLQSEGNLTAAIDLPGIDGTLRPDVSAVHPGDSFIVKETVTNRLQTAVRDAQLSLSPPTGWTVEPLGQSTASVLEPGGAFTATFRVAVPAGEATSPGVTIRGGVTYRGDDRSDRSQLSAEVPVLAPVEITSTAVTPDVLQVPGDSTTATVTLTNHLESAASHGMVSITGPSEWTVQPAQQPYQLAGGEQAKLTFEITPPPDTTKGARFQVATTYDGDRAGDSATFGVYLEATSWEFDTFEDAEGWQPTNHLTDFAVADGLLSTTSTGHDPFMILDRPLDIDATDGLVVEVVMQSSTSSNLQMYWGTADAPAFSEAQSALSPDSVVAGPMRTYRVAIPAQTSNLTALRIDPLMAAGDITIDTIRILR